MQWKGERPSRTDTGPAIQNGRERLAADAKGLRGPRDAHAQGLKAKGFDDLARMRGIVHTHRDALFSDDPRNRRNQRPSQRT